MSQRPATPTMSEKKERYRINSFRGQTKDPVAAAVARLGERDGSTLHSISKTLKRTIPLSGSQAGIKKLLLKAVKSGKLQRYRDRRYVLDLKVLPSIRSKRQNSSSPTRLGRRRRRRSRRRRRGRRRRRRRSRSRSRRRRRGRRRRSRRRRRRRRRRR